MGNVCLSHKVMNYDSNRIMCLNIILRVSHPQSCWMLDIKNKLDISALGYHFVTYQSAGLGVYLLGGNNFQGDYRDNTTYIYTMLLALMDMILSG